MKKINVQQYQLPATGIEIAYWHLHHGIYISPPHTKGYKINVYESCLLHLT